MSSWCLFIFVNGVNSYFYGQEFFHSLNDITSNLFCMFCIFLFIIGTLCILCIYANFNYLKVHQHSWSTDQIVTSRKDRKSDKLTSFEKLVKSLAR